MARRDPEFFQDREMDLLYVAKRLRDAIRLEDALTTAGVDYAVETDTYTGGFVFRTERTAAFFYVLPELLEQARGIAVSAGFTPHEG